MNEKVTALKLAATKAWASATTPEQQESVRNEYLGRKGKLAALMQTLPTLDVAVRSEAGATLNTVKQELANLMTVVAAAKASQADLSVPAYEPAFGTIHPISAMIEEMTDIFRDISFEVVEGNEIVSDQANFESLNLSTDHPARDGHDSFFITDDLLLRTQMTAVQVEEMKRRFVANQMPIRMVMPGKTYRRESDQTHSAMFHQLDAVMVDTQTTFADLRGILDYFVKRLFGDQVETRFRPHHFPFTEPSAELDIRWKGTATTTGKHTEWLEMGGCGMIHPDVLKRAGINPKIYQGWAFGMSVERPLMIRHQIPDLRLLFANSFHFLEQFPNP